MKAAAGLGLMALLVAGALWWATRDETPPAETGIPAPAPDAAPASDITTADHPALLEVPRPDLRPAPAIGGGTEPASDEGTGDIRYSGGVVDEANVPVPGATVVARFRGRVLAEVVTDAEGAYAFRTAFPGIDMRSYLGGSLSARGPGGDTAGFMWLPVATGPRPGATLGPDRDVPAIVLRPALALEVAVAATCGGGLPATVWIVPTQFGCREAVAERVTDADGYVRFEGLPPGTHRVVAAAHGCGRATKLVTLPQPEPEAVMLEIPDAHTLTVSVRERAGDAPILGAEVGVTEYVDLPNQQGRGDLVSVPSIYVADDRGVVVIEGLGGRERLTLHATAEGFPIGWSRGPAGPGAVRVPTGATEATIHLQRPRTIRWPLEDKGHGVPPDGTDVQLRPFVNSGLFDIPTAGRIEGGELVVDGWAPGFAVALAYAEGFGAARLHAGKNETLGHPAAFHPTRRIELFAKHADGTPAAGTHLRLHGPGNNQLVPAVPTDAEGYAVIADLYGGPGATATCFASKEDQGYGGWPLGQVDLHAQDGRFDFTVPVERTLRVTVLVDGAPPPEGFRVPVRLGSGFATLAPDADGLCEVTLTPGGDGPVRLYAHLVGYRQVASEPVSLEGSGPIAATLAFERLGEARVKVLLPEDGRNKIGVQGWDPEKRAWPPAPAPHTFNMGGGREADGNGWVTFRLAPGRYRAYDIHTGKLGDPFDVALDTAAVTTLDLRRSGWVKGRVVPPEGVPVGEFTVGAEGAPVASGPRFPGMLGVGLPGRPVNAKDGTFWFRIPGDAPVTLRVFHPTCQPHPTRGRLTLTAPREGVELHAIPGPEATVRFDPPLRIWFNPGQKRPATVRLYAGEVSGAGTALPGQLEGDGKALVFGGFEPGRYTVWIDTQTAAPLVLPDVELTGDDVDLGTHAPPRGSRLIVHVKVQEGQSPPRMHLGATRLGEPAYSRRADGSGARLVLEGLGPGRFQVFAATSGLQEEIVFDGTSDVERTIDLR